MAIPPLVCNSPPPIDQCDDDKDHDFDLRYNLSQGDEDSNEYDYDAFTSYRNFQSVTEKHDIDLPQTNYQLEPATNIEEVKETENSTEPQSDNSKTKTQDDINLEDLNLEVDRVSISSDKENESEINDPVEKERPVDFTESAESGSKETTGSESSLEDDPLSKEEDDSKLNTNFKLEAEAAKTNEDLVSENDETNEFYLKQETSEVSPIDPPLPEEASDDEFGDFDDFKFTSTTIITATQPNIATDIKEPESPWSGQQWEQEPEFEAAFGDFTSAEEIKSTNVDNESKVELVSDEPCDDDFDDFQSISVSNNETVAPTQTNSDLDSHSTITDESIENVVFSIFEKDISDKNSNFELKLESFLSETWRHLKETDIRQPYIVNWNSSVAQKSLLKALCIDSRNILFGPNWTSNMPRYAVNLGPAPLQPQKPPSTPSEAPNPVKAKPADDTWVDPFSSAGQESCTSEGNASTNPTAAPVEDKTPNTAPVVHEGHTTNESPPTGPIYSATLNIQPLRQLPDTHIFTPTDSEIPRSKTIHYDNSPTIIVSERRLDKHDNDFTEFQDFRETQIKPQGNDSTQKPPVYNTSILEPIKMEPLVPTLNWPDPGHVKETFEDFSDFVSNSAWDNNNQIKPVSSDVGAPSAEVPTKHIANSAVNNVEDDFDSFQSAIPNATSESKNNTASTQFSLELTLDNNSVFTKVENSNNKHTTVLPTQTISEPTPSINNLPITNKVFPPEEFQSYPTLASMPSTNQILQPISTVLSSTQSKPSTGQILQPLSLEGYSQINWPNPGLDLQDLSRFNPVEKLPSLKDDRGSGSNSKTASPAHARRAQPADDDIWGEFVSSKPKPQTPARGKPTPLDDEEWTDFVSSSSVKPPNGVNTISFNVHSSSNKASIHQKPTDIPTLNYITPKASKPKIFADKHFQNL